MEMHSWYGEQSSYIVSYIAVIPARCGSKGIPFKNIVDVCGKPLIQYTIDAAMYLKRKRILDDVIVSTDCEKIAQISKNLGASVPFLRPSNISDDKSTSVEYLLHMLEHFESNNVFYDSIVLLQPTSPLRTVKDIESSIQAFELNKSNSLISVYKEESINSLLMYKKNGENAVPLDNFQNTGIRRQDYEDIYIRNGAIYIVDSLYIKHNKRIVSSRPIMYEMSKVKSINIDTNDDLFLARSVICR